MTDNHREAASAAPHALKLCRMVRRPPGHAAPVQGVVFGCIVGARGGFMTDGWALFRDRPVEMRSNRETLGLNGIRYALKGLEHPKPDVGIFSGQWIFSVYRLFL